jgi:hypothetical protein
MEYGNNLKPKDVNKPMAMEDKLGYDKAGALGVLTAGEPETGASYAKNYGLNTDADINKFLGDIVTQDNTKAFLSPEDRKALMDASAYFARKILNEGK